MSTTPTLLEDLNGAAASAEAYGDSETAARLRDHARRLREEMAALEVRSKDKRDPLTDHAFCALNALTRINSGPGNVSR